MDLQLTHSICNTKAEISISGSKSETNRLLLLQALYPNITLANISNSDDSDVMTKALKTEIPPQVEREIDIHHAGTAMRFLTAYFSTQKDKIVTLTGSKRMKERPLKILVDALKQLGAKIEYLENEGFPPIKITGQNLIKNKVSLAADVSSQYISALLLVASSLENGLELTLEGKITSVPYIKMTLTLLNDLGIETKFENNTITVSHKATIGNQLATIESDWSSASYFYSIVALSDIGTEISLSSYKENSLQGDSVLAKIYENFGVQTTFIDNIIVLKKVESHKPQTITQNLNNAPDIAQTIAVTSFGLGVGCHLTGLHTLKIKETDRLEALKKELTKLGASITVTNDSLTLEATSTIISNISIETYQDHRMAMAFAPLALKTNITIQDAEVVSKSFPAFWDDLESIGFTIAPL